MLSGDVTQRLPAGKWRNPDRNERTRVHNFGAYHEGIADVPEAIAIFNRIPPDLMKLTSNTDAYSEQQINGLLDTRLKDKTVIVITHKKEILSKVDQIVVLKE